MVKPRIQLDPASLGSVENLRAPLEDQLNSALDAAVDNVDEQYHGEDVEQVAEELLDGTKAGLHSDIAAAMTPDEAQLRSVAATIVEDNTGEF
jgi:hypothetical protein